jgi:hypothetical protein
MASKINEHVTKHKEEEYGGDLYTDINEFKKRYQLRLCWG